jgi:phosphatidylglycerol:prolipoprotein diacylglycerol transferase
MAGCCYGRPTSMPWGIKFYSELVEPSMRGISLHPTQLYESFSMAALTGALVWLHGRKSFHGQVMLTYFMTYPVIRSIIEVFRGDSDRGFLFGGMISTSQFISFVVLVTAGVVAARRMKMLKRKAAAAQAEKGVTA